MEHLGLFLFAVVEPICTVMGVMIGVCRYAGVMHRSVQDSHPFYAGWSVCGYSGEPRARCALWKPSAPEGGCTRVTVRDTVPALASKNMPSNCVDCDGGSALLPVEVQAQVLHMLQEPSHAAAALLL